MNQIQHTGYNVIKYDYHLQTCTVTVVPIIILCTAAWHQSVITSTKIMSHSLLT